jgi:hypothetical protein
MDESVQIVPDSRTKKTPIPSLVKADRVLLTRFMKTGNSGRAIAMLADWYCDCLSIASKSTWPYQCLA